MINALSTLLLIVTFAAVLASQRLARSKTAPHNEISRTSS
jgi:hypothetical protein